MPTLDPNKLTTRALALKAEHPDWGYIRIANAIGWHKDKVRRAIEHAERKRVAIPDAPSTSIGHYEAACRSLAEAKAIDEVKGIRDHNEALRAYAHIAGNYQAEADLAEIVERAERKMGELLIQAKAAGQISRGKPPANCNANEQYPRVRLEDVGISRPLSMRAQKKAGIAERAFVMMVERRRKDILDGRRRGDILKDVSTEGKKASSKPSPPANTASSSPIPNGASSHGHARPAWTAPPTTTIRHRKSATSPSAT